MADAIDPLLPRNTLMSEEPRILTERFGHVLLITINRPEARNAFDAACAGAMEAAVDRLDRQADRAHHQWETHHRAGKRGAGPAKRKDDAEVLVEKLTERTAAAEEEQ